MYIRLNIISGTDRVSEVYLDYLFNNGRDNWLGQIMNNISL